MKIRITILALACLIFSTGNVYSKKKKKKDKETTNSSARVQMVNELDSVSYALGFSSASQLKRSGLDSLSGAVFLQAMNDGFSDSDSSKMTMEDAGKFLQQYFTGLQEKQAEAAQKEVTKYMAENKTKEGVVELASGLQYQVLTEGTGAIPTGADNVEVHYHGTLTDGTVFDSSVERDETIEFGVTQVIPGWTEALQLMKVGSKWKLFIPPSLGYGNRAAGKIPPNSILIFEVELISIPAQSAE